MELQDAVQQAFGPGRAAGDVDVHREVQVDPLDHRVGVEDTPGAGAGPHGDDPLGLGHLVVNALDGGHHLFADGAGHDHEIGLTGAGPESLHAEAGDVKAVGRGDDHFDGAAGQPEGGGPETVFSAPVHQLLQRSGEDVVSQMFFNTHVSAPCQVRCARPANFSPRCRNQT